MSDRDELAEIRADLKALAERVEWQGKIRDAQHEALIEHLGALQDLAVTLLRIVRVAPGD